MAQHACGTCGATSVRYPTIATGKPFRDLGLQGVLWTKGDAQVAFDPEGIVFAVGLSENTIKLYDVRQFDAVRAQAPHINLDGVLHILRALSPPFPSSTNTNNFSGPI